MGEKGFFMKNLVGGPLPAAPRTCVPPCPRRQQTGPPQQIARRKRPQQIAARRQKSAPLKYQLNQTKQARNNTPLSMTKQRTARPQQIGGPVQGMRKYSQNHEQMFV